MKKIITCSAQFKIISEQPNQNYVNLSQNHAKNHEKKLSKDRQAFINNIAACRFKEFSA